MSTAPLTMNSLLSAGPIAVANSASNFVKPSTWAPKGEIGVGGGFAKTPETPWTAEARAIETDTDEALRDRLSRLLAENRALSEANAAYETSYNELHAKSQELRRQLEGDPSAKQTRNDLRAERDHLRGRVTELETDLAWHKRELARGSKR